MKRNLTEFEEQVIRLIHHDFEGLTQRETAERLGTSQGSVSRALARIKKKAPQLFPILTTRQAAIHLRITELGQTHQEIADVLNVSVKTVDRIVEQMRIKGVNFAGPPKTTQYETYMDGEVKRKF